MKRRSAPKRCQRGRPSGHPPDLRRSGRPDPRRSGLPDLRRRGRPDHQRGSRTDPDGKNDRNGIRGPAVTNPTIFSNTSKNKPARTCFGGKIEEKNGQRLATKWTRDGTTKLWGNSASRTAAENAGEKRHEVENLERRTDIDGIKNKIDMVLNACIIQYFKR